MLKNKKTGGFREAFLPETDFQNSSAVNLTKKRPEFGGLETKQRHETQTLLFFSHTLLHMNSIQYKNRFGHLIGISSKCYVFRWQMFKKK